jgi:hypothetical protein
MTGNLDKLEILLNSHGQRSKPSSAVHQTNSASGQRSLGTIAMQAQANPSSSTNLGTQNPAKRANSMTRKANKESNTDVELVGVEKSVSRLLCCMKGARYATDLHQEILEGTEDDTNLFRFLRKTYHMRRGKFRRFWTLRGLRRIQFVCVCTFLIPQVLSKFQAKLICPEQFTYGGPRWIFLHENSCDVANGRCDCLPPSSLVGPEYRCDPVPPKHHPPVGPNLMRHLYDCPEDAGFDSVRILNQLPKRICGELLAQSNEQLDAWEIQFEEGWSWMRISIAVGLVFFFPSLLFGVIWGLLKHDLQSSFAIASWWMIGATIMLSITAAFDELY